MKLRGSKVDSRKCSAVFARYGYSLSRETRNDPAYDKAIAFVRPSSVKGCLEELVLFEGYRDASVSIELRLTLVRSGNGWMGMFENEVFCPEFNSNDSAFVVRTNEQLKEWEATIVPAAIKQHEWLSESHAELLLTRTETARKAAKFYLSCVDPALDATELVNALRLQSTPEQRIAAKNMFRISLLDIAFDSSAEEDMAFHSYQAAVHLIILKAGTQDSVFGVEDDPHSNDDLAWCIQILACHLFQRTLARSSAGEAPVQR